MNTKQKQPGFSKYRFDWFILNQINNQNYYQHIECNKCDKKY